MTASWASPTSPASDRMWPNCGSTAQPIERRRAGAAARKTREGEAASDRQLAAPVRDRYRILVSVLSQASKASPTAVARSGQVGAGLNHFSQPGLIRHG